MKAENIISSERRVRELASASAAAMAPAAEGWRWLANSWTATGLRVHLISAVLVIAYLFSGVIGHDPWKQDEAYTFGMVLHMLDTGDWVVPTLAGEPFMEKPPLFYMVAAIMANALSGWLPLHDGARLAATLFIAVGAAFTGATAHRLLGAAAVPRAVLLLVACFGLLLHAHEMITDTALFAGFAVAVYGLTWAAQSPLRAGALLGTGVGIGFMSKGLVEPVIIGLACVMLPIVSNAWRSRRYATTLAIALLFALPWLMIWPMALYAQNRDAFDTWFWTNNFGRYLGTAHLGADTEPWYYARVLPWFTFPAGPLALFAIWRSVRNRTILGDPATLLLCVVAGAIVLVLATAATARSLYALPLLIPLSILAGKGVGDVPQWIVRNATRTFGFLFGAMALGIWVLWFHGMQFGKPPDIEFLLRYLPRDFVFDFQPGLFLAALFCTALWLATWLSKRTPLTEVQRWVAGVTMVWGVTMSLCLPWIDHAKSFRSPFTELATLVPTDECVAGKGLGEPQRGMLHYFGGIVAAPAEDSDESCAFLIVQTNKASERNPAAPRGWAQIWSGSRAGEEQEHFTLYSRNDSEEMLLSNLFPAPDLLSYYTSPD